MFWLNGNRMRLVIVGVAATMVVSGDQTATADFAISDPVCVSRAINSEGCNDTQGCSFLQNGLKLYFAHNRPGGYGGKDIWVASRETINDEWGEPVNLGPNVNTSSQEAYPAISPDELELYLHPGAFATTLLRSTRVSKDEPWGPTEVFTGLGVPACDPDISADGLTVYFDSNRSGGYGGWDIWVAMRPTVNDPWGEPFNLGSNLNDSRDQYGPSVSNDGLVLFYNNGGLRHISMARRATKDDPWGPPVLLGQAVNGSGWVHSPKISPDGSVLYFDSGRSGGFNKENFWQVSVKPIVDLNSDRIVDAADMCIMVDYWGTDEKLCDIGPMPWGDGVVDVEDLIVLAEHLFEDYRMIAQWKLDETDGDIAYDNVSNYNGDLNGDPIWQPTSGLHGGALELDGIDDYVSIPFVLNPGEGSFSVFAWTKGGAPGQTIMSQAEGDFGSNSTWLCAGSTDGKLITQLMHPPFPSLESESIITDGQWHHVGLVYDRDSVHRYLYVDGLEVARDMGPVPAIGSNGGLYIGAGESLDATSFFSGLIDDVRIYNVALSAEEVAALVSDSGLNPNSPTEPLAHWTLDELDGEMAHDSTGTYDATLVGHPIWQPTGGMVDGALEFDGIGDYVETPFVISPADGSLSVFAWIKGGAVNQVIFSQKWGLNWLMVDLEGNLASAFIDAHHFLVSQIGIVDGQWHHVGLVWDAESVTRSLNIDGVEMARDTPITFTPPAYAEHRIGASWGLHSNCFWSGLIDDVRIYEGALSVEQIANLAQ